MSFLSAGPIEPTLLQLQHQLQLDEPVVESFMSLSRAASMLLLTVYGAAVAALPAAGVVRQSLPAAFVLAGVIASLFGSANWRRCQSQGFIMLVICRCWGFIV